METSYSNVQAEEPDIPKLANGGQKRSGHQRVESNLQEPKHQKLLLQTSQITNDSQDLMNGWDDAFGNYDPPEAAAYENHAPAVLADTAMSRHIASLDLMLAEC